MKSVLFLVLPLCGFGTLAHAVTVDIVVQEFPLCVYAYGALSANAAGGVGPYTYLWSTGSTEPQIQQLLPGTYSVTVTDFMGAQATDQITLTSQPLYGPDILWLPGCPDGGESGEPGRRLLLSGWPSAVGMAPFTSTEWGAMNTVQDQGMQFIYVGADPYQPGQAFNFTITDANGCQTLAQGVAPPNPQWLVPQVLDVNGACSGGSNGAFTLFIPAEPNGWASTMKIFNDAGSEFGWTSPSGSSATGLSNMTLEASGLPNGTYHVVQTIYWEGLQGLLDNVYTGIDDLCRDTLVIEVPDLGYPCGTLSGKVFVDANENCSYGSTDANLPNTVVEVQPGDHFAITNSSGQYTMNLPYGSYTVADQNALFQEHCGVEGTAFTVSTGQTNVTRNLADTSLTGLDVRISMESGAARPGFEIGYGIDVDNLTGVLSGAGTVTFTFDPALVYLNIGTTPTNVSGNVITWNLSSMGAFADRDFYAQFQVPPDISLLGQVLSGSATVSVAGAETELSNNTVAHTVIVTGSYDPNDKTVRTESGAEGLYLIDVDDRLEYTIRFQNTGTDTAFSVVITDTLQSTLDPATFQLGAASHPMTMLMRDNVLRFMFANILLPDINANEPRSHGFVNFSIKPHQPILPGTLIENIANIFFDFNPPVITEPSVLVAEFSTGVGVESPDQLHVFPVPTREQLNVHSTTLLMRLSILTLDGRMVREEPIQGHRALVGLQGLPSGAYLLRVMDTEGNQLYHPFLIEHE